MAFNSTTYHLNKHRKGRDEDMAKAREAMALARSDEREWGREHYLSRAQMYVRCARSNHRLFMMYRRFKRDGVQV